MGFGRVPSDLVDEAGPTAFASILEVNVGEFERFSMEPSQMNFRLGPPAEEVVL